MFQIAKDMHPNRRGLAASKCPSTEQLQSPGLHSPRNHPEPRRTPSSPNLPPLAVRRSASVVSLNRSQSPALGRKSSNSSLRGDAPGTPRGALSRRSSFNPNMPSPIGARSPLQPAPEEKLPLRACDVAEDYFEKELARHEGMEDSVNAGTIVIVHDQCYGHRFSRPKTPKATLSLIMERPERILASVLGISAAYVRLGQRHADGNHPPHPHHSPPETVPFKIRKTSRMVDITSQVVTNVHGTAWMNELKSMCEGAEHKLASTGKELARDPSVMPGKSPKQELHAGDLYLCPESMNAFQGALGGVLDAVDSVFQGTDTGNGPSRAFVCIRPPGHHCSDDHPSGFCWLNNVHVGIEHAMMNYGLTHAAIIDFDLHHGDGSQAITWARNKKVQNMSKNTPNWKKTSIGYFSLHDINSYPCEDGDDDKVQAASLCIDNAHGQSIWNVHLQSWKTPEQFWAIYEEKYMVLLEKTRLYLKHHTNRLRTAPNHPAPKAAIFLSAGFDASEWETAGMQRHSVNVPTEFYARFTRDVVRLANEEGTSVHGRVISVLEGGYSDRALTSGVLSHLSGLCDGQVWTDAKPTKGLAFDMRQRLGGLTVKDEDIPMQSVEDELTAVTYDPFWWNATQLAELENLVSPPPPVAAKKVRNGPAAHFSSPTQSFVAKVVDPTKLHRSMSGRYTASPSRAPTPPPPDVDWATAAQALSKLLIPADRQTRSHKPEDLAEVKVKKEKPAPPVPTSTQVEASGRQLRGRKAAPIYTETNSDDEKETLRLDAKAKADRRKTIADFSLASAEPAPPSRSVSRRMSIASSVSSIGERTSRAPSVATSRRGVAPATNGAAPVKKVRGAPTAANARAAQRPPVPRIPYNYSNKATVTKGKENDDVDALTTGLKRITLRLPPKEEYEAREKEKEEKRKAAEAAKKAATKPTAKKAPVARVAAVKPAAKPIAAKRGPGRPAKASKPTSPVETVAPIASPEAPHVQAAVVAPLEQPQPVSPEASSILPPVAIAEPVEQKQAVSEPERRVSGGIIEPPTELTEMAVTPEQLREQLPMPSFVTVTESLPLVSPPLRQYTPPPPPPSSIPQFVNYTSQSFGGDAKAGGGLISPQSQTSPPLQWVPANTGNLARTTSNSRPMSPASKRQDLPTFTANGVIPFASVATSGGAKVGAQSGNMAGQQGAAVGVKAEEKREDLWDIPDTPAR
ncbi:Arginase/deacetylase [Pyrenochaeta sp. DS3sAY3a]|nr:Arginase/deacetylase [Pyrenochaeta sp. DS3sAY3a]